MSSAVKSGNLDTGQKPQKREHNYINTIIIKSESNGVFCFLKTLKKNG